MRNRVCLCVFPLAAASLCLLLIPGRALAAGPCDGPPRPLTLNLAAAARTPKLDDGHVKTLGVAGAQSLADALTAGANPCEAPASADTARAIAAVDAALAAGNRAEAQRLVRALVAEIQSRRDPIVAVFDGAETTRVTASTAMAATGPCAIKREPTISPKDDQRIGDALKAQAAAERAGDAQAAADANRAANDAFQKWGDAETGQSSGTVGDYLVVAHGAQQMGQEGLSQKALDQARAAAERDMKASSTRFDPCTVSSKDVDCITAAVATGQLVGANGADNVAAATAAAMKAIEDRLNKKQVDDCEEWVFSMKFTALPTDSLDTEWTVRWLDAKVRINRKSKNADASRLAGYASEAWPGLVGSATGNCWEQLGDAPKHIVGPATITGAPFHYTIAPEVTADGVTLTIASADANYSMSAPSNLGCQALKMMGDLIFKRILHGPFPIEIPLADGQTEFTVNENDDGVKSEIHFRRIM
jgi:hypothetical protein